MMSDTRMPGFIRPLAIPALDEFLASPSTSVPAEDALSLLVDLLDRPADPLGIVRQRYKDVEDPTTEPSIVPLHDIIMRHVIRPLREAKYCYVLGMPVACIAQAGLVGEMVALWRFRMLEPKLDGRPLDQELQKLLMGREFDKLRQEERVRVLRAVDTLDEETVRAFGELRALRRQYMHFMVDPAQGDVDQDARKAYCLACKLFAKTLDLKFRDGACVFPPKIMRFIRDIVNSETPRASAPTDSQEQHT